MTLVLEDREYQNEAVGRSLDFLTQKKRVNGIAVVPCGGGKSLIAARILLGLDAPALMLQPRKELVIQNRDKLRTYGFEPAIFSASLNSKSDNPRKLARREVGEITLATIKSVIDFPEFFQDVRYVLIDEASEVNPAAGQYKEFFAALHKDTRYLGLDATPFRLRSSIYGSQMHFLTRINPRLFNQVVHYTQIQELFDKGYLARPQYFNMQKEVNYDERQLELNATGADYTDESIQSHLFKIGFHERLADVVRRLIAKGRRGVLVFTRLTQEAEYLAREVPDVAVVTTKTSDAQRTKILRAFKTGEIKAVANVGIIAIGFDYPELDTVVQARPTLSLRVNYQQVGRVIRKSPGKIPWVVDMVGMTKRFGKIDDLKLYCEGNNGWAYWGRPAGGGEVQLTNKPIDGTFNPFICKECFTERRFFRHEKTGRPAGLSKPAFDVQPYIAVIEVNGKKLYKMVKRGDPEIPEWVAHRSVCDQFKAARQEAAA